MGTKYRLQKISEPSCEPVAVADVKRYARIDHDADDSLISTWIQSGRVAAETVLRRSIITQSWAMYFDEWPEFPASLPRSPVQSIISFTVTDYLNVATALPLSGFILDTCCDPARISLAYGSTVPASIFRGISCVKILYYSGYGDTAAYVPAEIKNAIYIYCTYMNEFRSGEEKVPDAFYNLLGDNRLFI